MIFSIWFHISLYAQTYETKRDSLKKVVLTAKTDTLRASLYNLIADDYKLTHPDSLVYFAKKALFLAQKNNYNYGVASAYLNFGNASIIKGDYDKAASYFKKAGNLFKNELKIDEKNKNSLTGLAKAEASLGVIYSEENNYVLALQQYKIALKIYLELDDKKSISKAYNNIGVLYKSERNLAKALEYFSKALDIQEALKEPSVPVTLTNIGVIYFEQKQFQKASLYYDKALKAFSNLENFRGKALLFNYLGDLNRELKKLKVAEDYYNQSVSLSEKIEDKYVASLSLYQLGQLFYKQNQIDKALPLAEKSLQYAKLIGSLEQRYHSEKLVSDIQYSLGNHQLALIHFKAYVNVKDSVLNIENSKKFLKAEKDFEYELTSKMVAEKEKQQKLLILAICIGTILLISLLLILINKKQVKKRLILQKEVAEYEQKALHLQMNPHFVFNCLGSISSFIVQNGTDQALKYLSKFSKLMRLTLEYSKGSLIPIDKEIEGLQNYLELEQLRFHNKFTFSITSSERVEFNMGLPPLLIQPFVENAILHGLVPKEGSGHIKVNFDVLENQLMCIIEDDGIGISKSKEMKQKSVQAHQSMALDITKKRLEIMEATISKSAQIEIKEIDKNQENAGTRVTLRLPIQYMQ